MNKKDIILFVSIFCILALIVGGTYAYWQWESGNDGAVQVVFNTIKDIDDYVYYDGGTSHFVGNFESSSNHCGGKGNTLEFYINDGAPNELNEKITHNAGTADEYQTGILSAQIMMDVNAITDNIKTTNYVRWAVTAGDEAACSSTTIAAGDFKGKSVGSTIDLFEDLEVKTKEIFHRASCSTTNLCQYTVWVWVSNVNDPASNGGKYLADLEGHTIDVNVWTQINMTSAD